VTFMDWAFGVLDGYGNVKGMEYNREDVVAIEWPDEDDEDQTPVLKLSGKHFADAPDAPRRIAYQDIPGDVDIGPEVLDVAFLRGKVLKPCPLCHGEKRVEVLATTGPWDGRSSVYPCKCGSGWVPVEPEDLERRRMAAQREPS